MLKPQMKKSPAKMPMQPPSGGCVLKLAIDDVDGHHHMQPPSGGCVLKRAATRSLSS